MTDLDELSFSTDVDGGDPSNMPTETTGVLATIDHILYQLPNVVDAWRRPNVGMPTFKKPAAPTTSGTHQTNTLLMVGLVIGLIWLVK